MDRPVKLWGTCPACGHGPVFLYADGRCGGCTELTPNEHPVGGQVYTGKSAPKRGANE